MSQKILFFILIIVFNNSLLLKAGPDKAAPVPTLDSNDVITVFGATYSVTSGGINNVEGASFQAGSYGERKYDTENNTFKFLKELLLPNGTGVSTGDKNYMHIDIWSDVACTLKFVLWKNNWQTGGSSEKTLNIAAGKWESFDIPLPDLGSPEAALQYQISTSDWQEMASALYLDNFYFHSNENGGDDDDYSFLLPLPTAPAHSASNVKSIYSDSYTPFANFQEPANNNGTRTSIQVEGRTIQKYTDFSWGFKQVTQSEAVQNISDMLYLHLDLWVPSSVTQIKIIIYISGWAGKDCILTPVNAGGWNSIDIPLSNFNGLDGTFLQFEIGDIAAPAYIDNFYFYKNGQEITWTGTTDSDWSKDANWDPAQVPVFDNNVIIPAGNNQPVLASNTQVANISLASGASIDLNNYQFSATSIQAQTLVDPKKWYSIGFPFDVATIHSEEFDDDLDAATNFWLKSFNGTGFTSVTPSTLSGNTGYIIQLPTGYNESGTSISYISGPVTNLTKGTLSFSNTYELQVNPSLAPYPLSSVNANQYIYRLNSESNAYILADNNAAIAPFESVITVELPGNVQAALKINIDTDIVTGIIPALNNGTPLITHYLNLQGVEITQPQRNNIYLLKKVFASGKTVITKVIYK